jgi:subtilase family serine protease
MDPACLPRESGYGGALARLLVILLAAALVLAATAVAASPRPDLGVVNVTTTSDEVVAGGKLTIKYKIGNAGKAAARPSQAGFYLSPDETKSANDLVLAQRSVGKLKPGKSAGGSITVTVPNAAGLFRVIACVDDKRRVKETIEANNCRAIARDLHVSTAR